MRLLPGTRRERRAVLGLAFAAVLLRLALFLGRGDYVAFDEGWYLILGRNFVSGLGYTLNGDPHVTLSPLFPILAGATGAVLGDAVWGGRVVAAVASGLLVLPCWSIFRRLAGARTAGLACVLVAVLPSLAPFTSPFYIGWDLWVGAEPVLHLLLYVALALSLAAWRGAGADSEGVAASSSGQGSVRGALVWGGAGALFALAYLARPEAIIAGGLVGLAVAARALRRTLPLAAPTLLAVGFVVVAAPYWIYLHDATGRWQLTGRSVDIGAAASGQAGGSGPASTIERMLWDDEETGYLENLYGLDETGLRLASPYWGVPPRAEDGAGEVPPRVEGQPSEPADDEPPGPAAARDLTGAANDSDPSSGAAAPGGRPLLRRYASAIGVVVPVYLLPFALLGLLWRRRFHDEALFAGPVLGTSVLVALLVATDPRTQLILAPLAAFYAARGVRLSGVLFDRVTRRRVVSRKFAGALLAAVVVTLAAGTDARRLYLSLVAGSPQHMLGSGKRMVAEEVRRRLAEDEPIMSWHPAVAVYADRPWCVLPYAGAGEIVRYARSRGCDQMVVSAFHPSPWPVVDLDIEYVVVEIPAAGADAAPGAGEPQLRILENRGRYALGELTP